MKVLLIQPPFTIFKTETKKCHPPLGLAYLAASLKENHNVEVLDSLAEGYEYEEIIDKEHIRYGLSFENIRKRIADFSPDVVGISCLFSAQYENVSIICHIVKELNDRIITILGGAHPSAVPEEVLENSNVDFVVLGEGEHIINRLLEFVRDKKDIREIDGIGFKYNGAININRRKGYEKNLDSIPFPSWDLFPLEKYFKINNPHGGASKRVPFLPMITSRGCPFECIFCSVHNVWGRNYRIRSPENVLQELDYLVKKFNVKEVLFEDDNLTLNKERAKLIFQGIVDRKHDVIWSVPNGVAVQTLDDKVLELMRKSGCYAISIGVESGDEYVLKNIIRKPIELSGIKPVVNRAKKLGLDTTVFFVVGFPGETREHLMNTFHLAEDLNVDNINFFFATPLPGTRLLELCREKGLINGRLDYSKLKSDYPSFATDEYSIDDLISLVSYERLKLYFLFLFKSPRKFLNKVNHKILNDPYYFIRFGLKYLRARSVLK